MVDYPDELKEILEHIDTVTTRMLGAQMREEQRRLTWAGTLETGAKSATRGLDMLHGSASEASHILRTFLGFGVLGTAVMALVTNLTSASTAFNKLTDVGQSFGGSIFEMQRLAGESGLTLQQFTDEVTKSSTLIAQMSGNQNQAIQMFFKYQKGIRNTLEPFGRFGMTLTQLDDASAAYAETLRTMGYWEHASSSEREKATSDFIIQVNAMAAATGKSREEIMKMINEAERDPLVANIRSTYNQAQREAFASFDTVAASLPKDLGSMALNFMTQMQAKQGRIWDTEIGKAAIDSGRMDLIEPIRQWYEKAMAGQKFTPADLAALNKIKQEGKNNAEQLNFLGTDAARKMAAWNNSVRGYDPEKMAQRYDEALKHQMDPVTKATVMFEETFNAITGSFRESFYSGIGSLVNAMPGQTDEERLKAFGEAMTHTKELMCKLGEALGWVVGKFVQILPRIEYFIETFVKAVAKFNELAESTFGFFLRDDKGKASSMAKTTAALITLIATITTVVGGFKILKWVLGGFRKSMTINAAVVNLNAKSMGGAFGDMMRRREQAAGEAQARRRHVDKTGDHQGRQPQVERRQSISSWQGPERRAPPPTGGFDYPGRRQWRTGIDPATRRDPEILRERRRRVEQYKAERAERSTLGGRSKAPGLLSPLRSNVLNDFTKGGLMRMGTGMLMRGVVGGLVLGAVDVLGAQLIDAIPIGEKAKDISKDALSMALTGGAMGAMVGGPLGAVVGGMIGALASLVKAALPSTADVRQQILDKVAPHMEEDIAAAKAKLSETNTKLESARRMYEEAKDDPNANQEQLHDIWCEILRLQRLQVEQSDAKVALQKKALELVEQGQRDEAQKFADDYM